MDECVICVCGYIRLALYDFCDICFNNALLIDDD